MKKGKKSRTRSRTYLPKGILSHNGQDIPVETTAMIDAVTAYRLTQDDPDGVHVFFQADIKPQLLAAVIAVNSLSLEMPSMEAPLDPDWFEWQDKMHEAGQICTNEDVANLSGRALGTVNPAHAIYESDHGEI